MSNSLNRRAAMHFALGLASLAVAGPALSAGPKPKSTPVILVQNAFVRTPLAGKTVTAAYFDIVNNGTKDDRLLGATADVATSCEIHDHLQQANGMKSMVKLSAVAVPKAARVTFAPGGKHVMMFGVKAGLAEGTMVTLSLSFETAGIIKIRAPVRLPSLAPAGVEHSGHTH